MLKKLAVVLVVLTSLLISPSNLSIVMADERRDLQDMKERLIRIEERMVTKDELKTEVNSVRIELDTKITGGFALLFTTMVGLMGFVLWDRRSALAPAIRKNKELEEREEKLERALKRVAVQDLKLAEALRYVGLM